MKLYELVNKYHIGTDLSCAESMFRACNEYYHLGLGEETRKMFSLMGIGMQSGQSCCGTARDGQIDRENQLGYEMVRELTDFVQNRFGTLRCSELQKLDVYGYDDPCYAVVEEIAKKLEEMTLYAVVGEISKKLEEIIPE